jgi:hypothetical protein
MTADATSEEASSPVEPLAEEETTTAMAAPQTEASGPDLSGTWVGYYKYRYGPRQVPFEVTLRREGGRFFGRMSEPNIGVLARRNVSHRFANVVLEINERGEVRFEKTYENNRNVIYYSGSLDSSADAISGGWSFNRKGRGGSFEMRRQ